MSVFKFKIVKFDEVLIIKFIEAKLPEELLANSEKRIKFADHSIFFTGEFKLNINSYISLNLNNLNALNIVHFKSIEERDSHYNFFISAIEYTAKHWQDYAED